MSLPEGDGTFEDRAARGPLDPAEAEYGRRQLTSAVRLARIEAAERTDVVAEMRAAEIARLEGLQEALAPILAAVPPEAELFDAGLVGGDHPRLFVDMVAFVDMARDRRIFRFQQDTRAGRTIICESARPDIVAAAVASYIARRLVERERALACLPAPASPAAALEAPQRRPRRSLVFTVFGFLIDLLGTMVLVLLLLAGLWYAGTSLLAWSNGR